MLKTRSIVLVFFLMAAVLMAGALPTFAADRVKLTVWGRDLPDDDPAHQYIKAVVEGFQAANPDIELEYVALGDPGLVDKTKVAMSSGTGMPDIFQSWGGSVMGGYADAGRLLDLTDALAHIDCSEAAKSAMSWKGKTYGVAPFFAVAGVFINEPIFEELGIKIPTTIEELEAAADTLLANGIQPFACGARDLWPTLALYMYLTDRYGGTEAFENARSRKVRFDSEPFVLAAQKYQDWVKKGYFGDTPLSEAYGDAQQSMAIGLAAMHVTGSWMCAQYSDPGFTDQTLGFYPFPEMPGGKGAITDIMGQTDIGFAASIAAADKIDAVVRFMEYAMSVEACSAEPGRICSVPGVKAPSRLTQMASEVFGSAEVIQFWWDQDLPPGVTTPLNTTIQSFFLADTDVKQALAKYEDLIAAEMGPVQ